jgi:hypothetical protein
MKNGFDITVGRVRHTDSFYAEYQIMLPAQRQKKFLPCAK